MPSNNRSQGRVLFIWDLNDTDDRIPLGGLEQIDTLTNRDLLQFLSILLITTGDMVVQNPKAEEILDNTEPLEPGDYTVSADSIDVTDETVYTRASSRTTGERTKEFREAVQRRDGRCVVSKMENLLAPKNRWAGFQAAHIFPLAYEQQWRANDYGRWISIVPQRGGTINSVQNGIVLRADLHQLFVQYLFSINPDDGYRIILFETDVFQISGQTLDRRLLDHPARPPDQLFRWHFRQAVLANMRGAGEPIFEHDNPPNSDIMGTIMEGPKAAERMEFELFGRLAQHMEIASDNEGGWEQEDKKD